MVLGGGVDDKIKLNLKKEKSMRGIDNWLCGWSRAECDNFVFKRKKLRSGQTWSHLFVKGNVGGGLGKPSKLAFVYFQE